MHLQLPVHHPVHYYGLIFFERLRARVRLSFLCVCFDCHPSSASFHRPRDADLLDFHPTPMNRRRARTSFTITGNIHFLLMANKPHPPWHSYPIPAPVEPLPLLVFTVRVCLSYTLVFAPLLVLPVCEVPAALLDHRD